MVKVDHAVQCKFQLKNVNAGTCILKTIKNATDTSVIFLIHSNVTHFVYIRGIIGFTLQQNFINENVSAKLELHCALLLKTSVKKVEFIKFCF